MNRKRSTRKTATILCILAFLLIPSFLLAQDKQYEKAVHAYMKKDFTTAARILREYVAKNPDPTAYYLLGYALYKQKKHAEAARYFQEAYVLDPNISPVLVK